MDIYLIRDETEVGPYEIEHVRAWLLAGQVSEDELAWCEGMETWEPLHKVLAPHLAAAVEAERLRMLPPEPEPIPVPEPEPEPIGPMATGRQKALLDYMKVTYSEKRLTEAEAETLIKELTGEKKNAKRLAKWEDDRLELHPELFVTELQARMKDRPNYFYRKLETEGADCFNGVTKAHCQVLVGYLDVKYPHWDEKLSEATWGYFFPAIGEKFPQLVHRDWRAKLKFKTGPKVASESTGAGAKARSKARRRASGSRTLAATVVVILAILVALGAAVAWLKPDLLPASWQKSANDGRESIQSAIRGEDPAPKDAGTQGAGEETKSAPTPGTKPGGTPTPPRIDESPTGNATPLPSVTPPTADGAGGLPKPTVALFDPEGAAKRGMTAAAGSMASPPVPVAPAATVAPNPIEETTIVLTQSMTLQTRTGGSVIPAGTLMKVISRTGNTLNVSYMNANISVPVSYTNLAPGWKPRL